MKEMTTEEKARAYDRAIERAKNEYQTHKSFNGFREMVVRIFPELCKSEDEKIRKSLLRWLQSNSYTSIAGIQIDDVIDWLEKQGQVKESEIPQFIKEMNKEIINNDWGEYDRTMAFTLMRDVDQMSYVSKEGKNERIGWLNSLDEKFTSTESTWSEHDEIMKTHALQIINKYWNSVPDTDYGENEISESCYNWIKSLKDHVHTKKHWKPTDDQLADLKRAIDSYTFEPDYLEELYEDLKKLKEE